MTESQRLLLQINAYLDAAPRSACDVEEVGGCTLFFRRDSPMPELSYARPIVPMDTLTPNAMDEIRAAFAQHGRVCRWEFLVDLVPHLPHLLVRYGFPEPVLRPLMVVTPQTFRPENSTAAEIRPIRADETRAVDRVLSAAFGNEEAAADADRDKPDFLSELLERGACVYAAFVEGYPVAGGIHSPVGETTELAGIGTAPAFQRRGVAGALTSALVADAFARGCRCVFLSAADETVQRVYARIGFERIGASMDTADEARTAN